MRTRADDRGGNRGPGIRERGRSPAGGRRDANLRDRGRREIPVRPVAAGGPVFTSPRPTGSCRLRWTEGSTSSTSARRPAFSSILRRRPGSASTRRPIQRVRGRRTPPNKQSFSTIGISMRLGKAGVHTLYAIRYPTVSRVHVFELDVNGEQPSTTWIGCVEAPERILLNSIVPLPDGGFLASHFYERGPNSAAARERALAGGITGELWRWHASYRLVEGRRKRRLGPEWR